MNVEIDLLEGLKDPTKAKAVVKKVQDAIDELVLANKEALEAAKDANKVSEGYEQQLNIITKANNDLVGALKNIHTVLGAKSDKFVGDKEMKVLMDTLATFIMSSGAIKAGVITSQEEKK